MRHLMTAANQLLAETLFPGQIIQFSTLCEGRLLDITMLYDDGLRGYCYVATQFLTPHTVLAAVHTSYLIGRVNSIKAAVNGYTEEETSDEVFADIWVNADGYIAEDATPIDETVFDDDDRVTHRPAAGRSN